MILIWFSAMLFGLVHPGSKVLLSSGIKLEMFCFAYIGIRLLIQIPYVIKTKAYKVSSKKQLYIIFLLGIVGASLQLSEFAGIANGEEVSTVTFLVYTHPFWSILISKIHLKERLGTIGLIKLVLAALGIILVIGPDNLTLINLKTHWVSLFAGFLISCWINISNVARKSGFSTLKTNFYYDLASFACLATFILMKSGSSDFGSLTDFLSDPQTLLQMFVYSLFIGLLPNLLFYKGSAKINPLTAGYILLLEPIIASSVSYYFFDDSITFTFLVGALFILSANIPDQFFLKKIKYVPAVIGILLLYGLTSDFSFAKKIASKKIILLEIIPSNSTEYTVSSEKLQIETAAEMALEDALIKKDCDIKLEKKLEIGEEQTLISKVKEIVQDKDEKIVIGLSRTNFARVAAKVAVGTDLQAISVGASASNLNTINSNFVTIVNPWQEQFKLIRSILKEKGCSFDDTLGIFNPANYLSNKYMEAFRIASLGITSDSRNIDLKKRCLFIGLNFSEAMNVISKIQKTNWKGNIIGLGDWNIHSKELTQTSSKLSKNIHLYVPTGWTPTHNLNSQSFSKNFETKAKAVASPIAAYTYDATFFAIDVLCNGKNFLSTVPNSSMLLRVYKGKNETGNFLSDMHIRTIQGLK